jgi:hypothetical protein
MSRLSRNARRVEIEQAPADKQTIYDGRMLIGAISKTEAGAFVAHDADGTLIGEYRSRAEAAGSLLDLARSKRASRP